MASENRVHVGRIVFGLFFAWLGVLFFLDQIGWIDIGNWWRFWPVILIVIGLVKLLTPPHRSVFGAIFLMALGGFFLFSELQIFHLQWRYVYPAFIVVGGLAMVFRGLRWSGTSCGGDSVTTGGTLTGFAILGGVERKVTSQDFRGGDATAILGGCDIDLRGASIAPGTVAVLDCFAFWGGIEIKVPGDWTVEVSGVPILGGFADSRKETPSIIGGFGNFESRSAPVSPTEKRLKVKGIAMMGGVEVKN
jgi:cell wall-active antibiotic response 4TMS protein YvqF